MKCPLSWHLAAKQKASEDFLKISVEAVNEMADCQPDCAWRVKHKKVVSYHPITEKEFHFCGLLFSRDIALHHIVNHETGDTQ